MFKAIRIAIARKAYNRAAMERRAYYSASNKQWNINLAGAYDARECAAANKLARLINPNAILRAF
jgi:hypothetical protein